MMRGNSPRKIALLVIALLLISSSCTPQEVNPDQDISQDISTGSTIPSYLGIVDDPAGEPVAFADLGGTETTTWEGVGSGEFSGYEGGWLPVDSMGFASGFAYLHPAEDNFPFFTTTLTPFQSLVFSESREPLKLSGYLGEDFHVVAEVSEETFPQAPIFFGLTAINPLHIKPRYADTELEKGLRVQQAIALQAFDETWAPLDLPPGTTVSLHLEFLQPPSDRAAFAIFDPNDGVWRELDPSCVSLDPTTYTCELTSFTPLLAVFDIPSETVAIENPGLRLSGSTLGALLSSNTIFQEGVDGNGGGVDGALDQLEDWLKQQQEESGGFDPDDPTLKELVDKVVEEVLKEAAKNRNESGKKALFKALDLTIATGNSSAEATVKSELAKLSDEIGKKALNESDCGEFRKVLKAAEQVYLGGGSMDLYNQLIQKATEMTVDCDVWDGDILVSMRSVTQHPAGLPMRGSGGNWQEIHKVQIWTNVDDFVMHGESKVTHILPTATFFNDKDCKSEIQMSGIPGDTSIFFEGFYNGYEFNVLSVTPQGGATIKQHWTMKLEKNEKCETVLNRNFSFSPYYSLIAHGVSSDTPPINIQEILDTGAADPSSDGLTRFTGYQLLSNPDPELGVYPFQTGYINWNFFHTEQKLPLQEEE
jgi:hypothetical protein